MKKLLVFLLLCTTGLWAQTTVPTVAELDFPSGQNLTMAYVPNGYYALKSTTPNMSVHKMIQADSLPSQRWKVTVGRRINTATWELQIDGSLIASPNVRMSYKDTVNLTTVGTGVAIPDRTIQLDNNGGEMTQIVPYQTTWRVPFKTSGITSGDVVEWLFTRTVPARADSIGREEYVGIHSEHEKVHEGNYYSVWYDTTLSSANDSLKMTIVTPANVELHLVYLVDATAKTYFVVRESVTITSGDTVAIYNSNRNSSATSGAVCQKNAVVTVANRGTLLRSATLGASGAGKTGGASREELEIVLKKSTSYEFVAAATAASTVNLSLQFYVE